MSPLPPDPYAILGVAKDAQIPEIRSAHRKLVLKCHPDKVQDPTLKAQKQDEFQKVQQAYEILSDDKERQKYDDMVRLAELRKQYQSKPNTSSPRATKFGGGEYEVRTAEPRSFKATQPPPPGVSKQYYSRSYEDNMYSRSPHSYPEPEIRTPRREQSYQEKTFKRESDREREREGREKEKDRERRRAKKEKEAEDARREEKERKKEAKRQRDKSRSKEVRSGTEEKIKSKATAESPYIETYDDEIPAPPRTEKKKGSKKHDDRRDRDHEPRDRSAHREEPSFFAESNKADFAKAYINKARGFSVSDMNPPAAPTPPPAGNTPFAPPPPGVGANAGAHGDEDIRRSSARPRRDSAEGPGVSRERSFHKPSREPVDIDEPVSMGTSPRHGSYTGNTPPRGVPTRHNTVPTSIPEHEAYNPRAMPIPHMSRAATFSNGYDNAEYSAKGRGRSRMFSQEPAEAESEDYDDTPRRRDTKDRKHRSSRKPRSPERSTTYYKVGKTGNSSKIPYEEEEYDGGYYQSRSGDSRRPGLYTRETTSYTTSYPNVKTSRSYGADDVSWSPGYNHSPDMRATAQPYA
ncbi:hypothetical protein N3K66_007992 [Trichothecium roseum]|uniref:Uncharacterized protein n=1 Tax=Trichothecium roseum TaxID=47278 RepID=A0ACC0UTC4_9HYPO|nr:hypothetical protein N3K66_007992 [Trichothecium roseum]